MKKLLICGLLVLSVNAYAAYEIEGEYKGSGEGNLSMTVMVLDNESGAVAVSEGTDAEGCSGTISGIGTYANNVLKFTPYKKEPDAGNCEITATFNGKNAEIVSSDCGYYHGAACGFDGKVKFKK